MDLPFGHLHAFGAAGIPRDGKSSGTDAAAVRLRSLRMRTRQIKENCQQPKDGQ
jgi:hypothetical protein